MHRIGFRDLSGDENVARLVVGGYFFLGIRYDQALPLDPHHNFVFRLFEMVHRNRFLVLARGQKSGFVDEIGEIRSRESGSALGEDVELYIVVQRNVPGVHLQYSFAPADIGPVDDHLPVEPAGPQQRGVEHVRPVRRGDDDDAAILLESIHLYEELVQRLFAFIVPTAQSGAPVPADCIDFIDKYNRGCILLSGLEQVPDAARTDSDKHLDEFGAGD